VSAGVPKIIDPKTQSEPETAFGTAPFSFGKEVAEA